MTTVLGVDGCRGGWVGALVAAGTVDWLQLPDVASVLAVDADAIGIDIPIGLPATGRRDCDRMAKRELGRAHSRVFFAPPRGVLQAHSYAEAGQLHRALAEGLGMSVQSWHLVDRIRAVDEAADDQRLVEVHPELSFAALTGQVLPSKKTAEGRAARLAAVRGWLPGVADVPGGDDGLDALAASWSARRWLTGAARSLPVDPSHDDRGRPMRIVI